jgi:hypothetical protein
MEGYSITELLKELKISESALRSRIKRLKIKAKYQGWLYDKTALEKLRKVGGKGRPPKQ